MTDRRRRRVVRAADTTASDQSAGSEVTPDTALAAATVAARPTPGPVARAAAGGPGGSAINDATWPAPELDTAAAERGLRGLVGGGSSQVSPAAALRARDAARPTDEDLARSEANLTIVRRNWTPHD